MSALQSSVTSPARYVMLGGFLGAGKTTAVLQLARWFSAQGRRVGLISNDQGGGLVDTALMAARGFAVREIPGGCFCCRFNSLVEAAQALARSAKPDVFIAEPVGSCTDLVATVTYPLRRLYGEAFRIAPLSVLIDPVRAARVLGLESGGRFSDQVRYIYGKQLEEADALVINKCDLLTPERLGALRGAVGAACPQARVFEVSAREGTGLEAWFAWIATTEQTGREALALDYATYAEGEARLGWLNATVELRALATFDANALLTALAGAIQQGLAGTGAEVAHLKMTFDPRNPFGDLSALSLVRNDCVPELTLTLPEPVPGGELTLNLRAEADPAALQAVVETAVGRVATDILHARVDWRHLEAFKPGAPQPTHRMTAGSRADASDVRAAHSRRPNS